MPSRPESFPSTLDLILERFDRTGYFPPVSGGSEDDDPKLEQSDDKTGSDDKSSKDSNGKSYTPPATQEDLDRLIASEKAKAERKAKKEALVEAKAQFEAEQDEAKKKQAGEFEKLYEDEQKKVTDLEAKIAKLEEESTAKDLSVIRSKMAAKYKLPDTLADRLKGDDEAEIEADAKEMAKTVQAQPPDPETGTGVKSKPSGGKPNTKTGGYQFASATGRVPFPGVQPKKE